MTHFIASRPQDVERRVRRIVVHAQSRRAGPLPSARALPSLGGKPLVADSRQSRTARFHRYTHRSVITLIVCCLTRSLKLCCACGNIVVTNNTTCPSTKTNSAMSKYCIDYWVHVLWCAINVINSTRWIDEFIKH